MPNGCVAWPTCIGSISCCSAGGRSRILTWSLLTTSPWKSAGDLVGAAAAADDCVPPRRSARRRARQLRRVVPFGKCDRDLLEAEHRVARIGGQDLARVLDGNDRKAARNRDWIADRARRHFAERVGKRRRQLLGPNPAEIAADRRGRRFGILAGVAGEGCAVAQLRRGSCWRCRASAASCRRSRRQEDLADAIFLGALRGVQLVEHRLDLVVADADAALDLGVLQPLPGDFALDLAAQRS